MDNNLPKILKDLQEIQENFKIIQENLKLFSPLKYKQCPAENNPAQKEFPKCSKKLLIQNMEQIL